MPVEVDLGAASPRFAADFDRSGVRRFSEERDRAYVLACFSLARVEDATSTSERQSLYERMVKDSRRGLLAELSGEPTSAATLMAVAKAAACEFTREDWIRLIRYSGNARGKRLFGHLTSVSAALVRQLDAIPPELWLPRLVDASARVGVTPARWEEVRGTLRGLDAERRTTTERAARRVNDTTSLWDWYHDGLDASREGVAFTGLPRPGGALVVLDGRRALLREGRAMKSCLADPSWVADHIERTLRGEVAYYRWQGEEPATVELSQRGGAWHLHAALGFGNAALSEATMGSIRETLSSALGAAFILDPHLAPVGREPGVDAAIAIGRSRFDETEIARVGEALARISGRSLADDNAAHCCFSTSGWYVQYLAKKTRPVYVAEVVSHRNVPSFAARLTDEVVTFLDRCGFAWPRARRNRANFAREMAVRGSDDPTQLAAFTLGVMAVAFGHSTGGRMTIDVHVP